MNMPDLCNGVSSSAELEGIDARTVVLDRIGYMRELECDEINYRTEFLHGGFSPPLGLYLAKKIIQVR